jgi:hypothetical protein
VIADGENLNGGTDISVSGGVGPGSAPITIAHSNTTNQGDVSTAAGAAVDSISLDGNGHVTGLGTEDFDNRFVLESGDTMSGALTVNNALSANKVNVNGVSGNASTDGSRGIGAPSVYTDIVEAQTEKGGESTYIQLSTGGPKAVGNDEIGIITDGIVQTKFDGEGIDTSGELTENAAL